MPGSQPYEVLLPFIKTPYYSKGAILMNDRSSLIGTSTVNLLGMLSYNLESNKSAD